jgi:hypothetical protein
MACVRNMVVLRRMLKQTWAAAPDGTFRMVNITLQETHAAYRRPKVAAIDHKHVTDAANRLENALSKRSILTGNLKELTRDFMLTYAESGNQSDMEL